MIQQACQALLQKLNCFEVSAPDQVTEDKFDENMKGEKKDIELYAAPKYGKQQICTWFDKRGSRTEEAPSH